MYSYFAYQQPSCDRKKIAPSLVLASIMQLCTTYTNNPFPYSTNKYKCIISMQFYAY